MRKLTTLFIILLTIFAGSWIVKSKTPAMRPNSYANGFSDDSLWWNVKVDSSGVSDDWILDPEIPSDYIPVPGENELYMVVDGNGYITGYRQREKQTDGSWVWKDVNPDIPENYEPVKGLENVYRVTDKAGNVKYYKYIRNEDDTFAFVEVDEKGNMLNDANPKGEEIPESYVHLANNVYAVKNENGVVIAYKQRHLNSDGGYSWTITQKPTETITTPNISYGEDNSDNSDTIENNYSGNAFDGSFSGNSGGNTGSSDNKVTINNSDGTYTETETYLTTEKSGGWESVYETKVTRVYDKNGKLLSTRKEGPIEKSKKQIIDDKNNSAPDKSKVASNLSAEVARISAGVSFDIDLEKQILAKLNAERASQGKTALKMDANSNAYKIAKARAAAMAKYDYSDYNSPLYGNLQNMLSKFGIKSVGPSENTWRTTSKTADAIHARFMQTEGGGTARMGSAYKNVGIAVAQRNGYVYICEVLID